MKSESARGREMRSLYDSIHRLYGRPERWVQVTRARLERHRISQGKLARRAGVDPSHLSKWIGEKRTTTPTIANMLLVDEALLDLIELVDGPEAVDEELKPFFPKLKGAEQ